ncbi:hypothetical protein NECAME_03918 [Necator americanus]|uniref:Uncharacterized protein n=1 Tax=Necator americanus TaxID=51031 RepID=W2T0N7_NECAM|nr:hypothetical protein NECAME_03918 [Necator americanus]ETN74786.1 hypothetical protein NECAME_03918 [Necator americanus]
MAMTAHRSIHMRQSIVSFLRWRLPSLLDLRSRLERFSKLTVATVFREALGRTRVETEKITNDAID